MSAVHVDTHLPKIDIFKIIYEHIPAKDLLSVTFANKPLVPKLVYSIIRRNIVDFRQMEQRKFKVNCLESNGGGRHRH